MTFKTKLSAFLSQVTGSGSETSSARTVMDSGQPEGKGEQQYLPAFLRQHPIGKQMQILGACLLLVVLIIAVVVFRDRRQATHGTAYVAAAGEMRMLSQRLAKASSLALLGDATAFQQLKDSRDGFATNLDRLTNGGQLGATTVPASPDSVQSQLQALTQTWEKTDSNAARLLEMEKNLISLGKDVASINEKNPQLLEVSEQVAALKLQGNSGPREIAAANQLVMLTQRIAKNASALLVGDAIDPEIAFLLGKDTNTFRDTLRALTKGSDQLRIAAAGDSETKQKLNELDARFTEYRTAVSAILANMQKLVIAKQAGSQIFRDSEELLQVTDQLAQAYQSNLLQRAG
jgi:twitching motility protein PilJ